MHIEIVGGGPAGLYFAILAKRLSRRHSVRVYERNPSNQFGGWGVILSKATLANMRRADPISYDRLQNFSSHPWEYIDIIRAHDALRVKSGGYIGIRRQDLLQVLGDRCRELDVEIRFNRPISNISDLASADLVVGADGVNSAIRTLITSFQPTFSISANRYLWLGVPCRLDNLQMIFKAYGDGYFVAQTYPSGKEISTFVIECTYGAWLNSDLRYLDGGDVLHLLSNLFRNELRNHQLMSTDGAQWRQFVTVHNPVWHSGRTILLGDALHSIHFSVGSGTKLAVEDAVALVECLRKFESQGVGAVFDNYERVRRSSSDSYQDISKKSYRWCEQLENVISLDIVPFTEQLLTRAGLYDRRTLALLAPEFSKMLREWKSRR